MNEDFLKALHQSEGEEDKKTRMKKKIESAVKELQSKCDEIYGRFDAVMDLVNDIGLKNIKRTENIRLMLENERYFKTLSTSQIDRSFERGISRLEECHKQMTINRFIPRT